MIKITTAHTANRSKNARKSFPISNHLPRLRFCRGMNGGPTALCNSAFFRPLLGGAFLLYRKAPLFVNQADAWKHGSC